MLDGLKSLIRPTPLAWPYIYLKGKRVRPWSQNDESQMLASLLHRFMIPRRFIEFGFGGWEFNCASLADAWDGLLIDADAYNVTIAKIVLPRRVKARRMWLTLDNLGTIRDFAGDNLGILSIDIDGNDFWFLKELITLRPALIISEYNSIFGLRSITVPYDPAFDRQNYPFAAYFGASLPALTCLAEENGYGLMAANDVNAFFVRNDLLGRNDKPLTPQTAYREHVYSGCPPVSELWGLIKDLPFTEIRSLSPSGCRSR